MHIYQRLNKNILERLTKVENTKIIALLGARQVGKTTLLEDFASGWQGKVVKYLGDKLEDAILWRGNFSAVKDNLEIHLKEPLEGLTDPSLLIFDEVQKIPEAFNNLKILHDSYKDKIKIVISGSSSLRLLSRTTESLGGRVEIAIMYPLSFTEILSAAPEPHWINKSIPDFTFIKKDILEKSDIGKEAGRHLKKALTFGLFPEAFLKESIDEVKLLHQNYHQTYIEKDIRDLKEVGNVLDFDLVWKIAHSTTGQLLSYSNIAQESGLAFNTVKKYVSILNATFNILLLLSFTRNIRRRVVKSPKVFSQDLGFFNHCVGIYEEETLIASQLVGRIFESLLIMEFFKQERFFLMGGEPYFYRTSAGREVDLIVEKGGDIFAYEFKFADKVSASDFAGIKSLANIAKEKLKAGFVVSCQPDAKQFAKNLFAVPWWYFCV